MFDYFVRVLDRDMIGSNMVPFLSVCRIIETGNRVLSKFRFCYFITIDFVSSAFF